MLLDIHTHRLPADASAALLSCCMRDVPLPEGARFISAGIHPWYLTREDYPRQLEWVVSMLNDRRVIALGEAAVRSAGGGISGYCFAGKPAPASVTDTCCKK